MYKPTVIETRDVERDYGFRGTNAIIDHPKHGRLLVCDGFGGMDTLRGGAVRWEHGIVVLLRADDTFATIDPTWDYVRHGYDDDRPIQMWGGQAIASLAKACGL